MIPKDENPNNWVLRILSYALKRMKKEW
jgi:hypothetical protein